MISDKARQTLIGFINELPDRYQAMFKEIAEYAISLGYSPKKTKSKDFVLDFSKSKVKRTIMKLEIHDNAKDSNGPGIRLKFYANKEYSNIFKHGIQRVIEEFGGKYTGCYGCGKCKGELEGYTFIYPDGRKVFRCGGELIAIHNFNETNIPEIKRLMSIQDEFYMNKLMN